MEVDFNPNPSPGDSRHSSPFRINLPASASTLASTSLSSMGAPLIIDRKRRRSLQQLSGPLSPSIDCDISGSSAGEQEERDEEERGGSSKRRHIHQINHTIEPFHRYRALGSAYVLGSYSLDSEYAVDSTMHSLSLASPCPSPPMDVAEKSPQSDIDMGDDNNLGPSTSYNDKTSSVFVPRQLKQSSLLRIGLPSTVPLRSSPLVYSERFHQSSSSSSQTSSSFVNHDSQKSASSIDSSPRKSDTAHTLDDQSTSCDSSPDQTTASISHYQSVKFNLDARTPSPSPTLNSASNDTADGRKANYSPGLSQASFPSGKHMLRYTMGYREDCSACKSKTPGHYGHVMHR